MAKESREIIELREVAEKDLYTFASLVNPERLYGEVHKEVFKFLAAGDMPNALLLLPRAHMKSHCVAVWCAWYVTTHPETTILYLSATSALAESQLYAIKNILTSGVYTRYWPGMVHPDEGKRERWTTTQICVDHPQRKEEGIRDPTIIAAGLTTNTTGFHADVIVPDDVVVPDNAYTEDGRRKVAACMSQMASILNTGGIIKACGTRYHPRDQYDEWKKQKMMDYDEDGDIIGESEIWEIMEKVVETEGKFLWPREARKDGKEFGFNLKELSRIRAMYTDTTQFYAQYYNNPNDPSKHRISRDKFQYYDPKNVKQIGGRWFFKGKRLNVYASIDFAFSLNKRADSTAIVVIGIDSDGMIYVLDIDRFKTDKIAVYFEHVLRLHSQWDFRKLRAEVTVAQDIIANDLIDRIRAEGMRLSIDKHRPTRHEGTKEERIASILEHRYDNMAIWHARGGFTTILEEELILAKPPHDDIKDSLASAIEIAIKPKEARAAKVANDIFNTSSRTSRFGGVTYN